MAIKTVGIPTVYLVFFVLVNMSCLSTKGKEYHQWNERYDFVEKIQPLVFHYDHGVLSGSYPDGRESINLSFNDVCVFLGHVCLCGAGGYRISQIAVDLIEMGDIPPERGDFVLISSRDHTVSDVIAYVLGCSKRDDARKCNYFIDGSIEAPKREYHYYIAYPASETAVHIIYRKHLLIGHEEMDKLWKIELAHDEDPSSIDKKDMELYRKKMEMMVKSVLFDEREGLFTALVIQYEDFLKRLQSVKSD